MKIKLGIIIKNYKNYFITTDVSCSLQFTVKCAVVGITMSCVNICFTNYYYCVVRLQIKQQIEITKNLVKNNLNKNNCSRLKAV